MISSSHVWGGEKRRGGGREEEGREKEEEEMRNAEKDGPGPVMVSDTLCPKMFAAGKGYC